MAKSRKEWERITRQDDALVSLGFTQSEAESLRRISMTLQRWYEAECNGDIQRHDGDGMTYRHYGHNGGPYLTVKCADREAGARKRLAAIVARRNAPYKFPHHQIAAYIQGDPRGAALYIIRPGDVPEGADVGAYYSRGIVVY